MSDDNAGETAELARGDGAEKPLCGSEEQGFKPAAPEVNTTPSSRFLKVELELNTLLRELTFSEPVRYIYNPLEYAWETHRCYVEKYCQAGQRVLFLGMNPGPFGMAQTGVTTAVTHIDLHLAWYFSDALRTDGVFLLAGNAEAKTKTTSLVLSRASFTLTKHETSPYLTTRLPFLMPIYNPIYSTFKEKLWVLFWFFVCDHSTMKPHDMNITFMIHIKSWLKKARQASLGTQIISDLCDVIEHDFIWKFGNIIMWN